MSLWQADDESTSIIMQRFYELLRNGLAKDAALRQAKLDYLAMNRKSFPYFWGAFVLMGDDAPLELRSNSYLYWIGGALLVILIPGILIRHKIL